MAAEAVRHLADLDETRRLGAEISLWLQRGDVVTLDGPIGAGKTELARAILRELATEPDLDVPSPTFTLIQTYPTLRVPAAHADLYRLNDPDDLAELGLDETRDTAALLVEWPDRMNGDLPADRLAITLEGSGTGRTARLQGHGAWAERLDRAERLHAFLDRAGWGSARREWLQGDASTRTYERVWRPNGPDAVLMNAPPGSDGPPVRNGLSYSRIAHLAEDAHAFVAVDLHLRSLGLSAPQIITDDLDAGFLLLERLDGPLFGDMVARGEDVSRPYEAAAEALAVVHAADPPDTLPVPGRAAHSVPDYDRAAQLIEVELLLDWTWPHMRGAPCPSDIRREYLHAWDTVLDSLSAHRVLTLRDYHSPNLIWLHRRTGPARAGLLDFQDALKGHPAYDLVSLTQDARIKLPPGIADTIMSTYLSARPKRLATLEPSQLHAAMAVLGAQRATKVVGIFTRLADRDGKTGYLGHIPLVAGYLRDNMRHAALAPVQAWFARHLDVDALAGQNGPGSAEQDSRTHDIRDQDLETPA